MSVGELVGATDDGDQEIVWFKMTRNRSEGRLLHKKRMETLFNSWATVETKIWTRTSGYSRGVNYMSLFSCGPRGRRRTLGVRYS